MFEEIVTTLFLGCSAWTDWKKHEISLILTGIYASTGPVSYTHLTLPTIA